MIRKTFFKHHYLSGSSVGAGATRHALSQTTTPGGRNIGGTSKCIEILRCDPRIQYKGFYRLTLFRRTSATLLSPSFRSSHGILCPVFSVAPSFSRARFSYQCARGQFTMELLQRAVLHNAPNNASMQHFDMRSASAALYTERPPKQETTFFSHNFCHLISFSHL